MLLSVEHGTRESKIDQDDCNKMGKIIDDADTSVKYFQQSIPFNIQTDFMSVICFIKDIFIINHFLLVFSKVLYCA